MTFVAQTYEQFVDDLLTALTGGIIREEHRFVDSEQSYSLSTPNPIASTLKVFGQFNEQFTVFVNNIDYRYDPESGGIRWKESARLPDDYSYFYTNYYPVENQSPLTDRNPGSVTTTLAEAFAREFAVLHKQMELIYKSAFVELAGNSSLDHVAALLGLTRKDARFASGEVLFKRSTPATGDIIIPSATLVSTGQGQVFETTDKRTLRKDQLSVMAPIRAQEEGQPGKVEAENITIINRPIFGIESVINDAATFFAAEKETDEEFRRRIRGTLERAGKSTLDAIKYSLIEEIPEVTENNIQIAELPDNPGYVEVKFGLDSSGDADLINRIENSIFAAKAAGIRVTHNLAGQSKQTSTIAQPVTTAPADLAPAQQTLSPVQLPAELLAQMPEGLLNFKAEVFLKLAEQNLTAAAKETIQDQVRQKIINYFDALPMGLDVIYNKLLGQVVLAEKIADVNLMISAPGHNKLYQNNIAAGGRKARIEAGNIFVGLMEETVWFDCIVMLESKDPAASEAIPSSLQGEGETLISNILSGVKEKLDKETLRAAIKTKLEESASSFQLIAGDAVTMNAAYEESGRVQNNTNIIVIEDNQRIRLRHLEFKLKGVLDG